MTRLRDFLEENRQQGQQRELSPLQKFFQVPKPEPRPMPQPGDALRTLREAPESPPQEATAAGAIQTLSPLQKFFGVAEGNAERLRLMEEKKRQLMTDALQARSDDPRASALLRGFQAYTIGMRETAAGLSAIGATVFGDEQQLDEAAETFVRLEQERAAVAPRLATPQELITRDDATLADFVEWAAFTAGEQIPNIATLLATGGIGGLIGRAVAKKTAQKALTNIEARAILRKASAKYATVGAFAGSTALGTGESASEQMQATGEVSPLIAVGAGAAKGVLEILTPLAIMHKFGFPTDTLATKFVNELTEKLTKGGIVKRTAGGALVIGAGEAVTEGLQEVVDLFARDFVDNNFELMSPESAWRIFNAAATGGLVGAKFGAVTGALTKPEPGGRPATEEELARLLPTPEFTQPGAFMVGQAGTSFQSGFDAVLSGKPNEIYQVDMAQISPSDMTVRAENLTDAAIETAPTLEIQAALRDARTNARTAKELRAEGTTTAIKNAERKEQIAQMAYQEAIDAGFRYIPPGGIEQLKREGFEYVGTTPIPQSALRKARPQIDPYDVLSVAGQVGPNAVVTSRPHRDATKFYLRGELEEHQITAHSDDLNAKTFDPERINFVPGTAPEAQQQMRDDLLAAAAREQDDFIRMYNKLRTKGLRVKVDTKAGQRFFVTGAAPRTVPKQLEKVSRLVDSLPRYEPLYRESVENYFKNDFKGSTYSYTDHKPGEIRAVFDDVKPPQHAVQIKTAQLAVRLAQRMLPKNTKLVIDFRKNRPENYRGSFAWSAKDRNGGFSAIIYIADNVKTEAEMSHILFHEFGHVLSAAKLGDADVKTRSAIFTEFLHHIGRQSSQTTADFFLEFSDATRMEYSSVSRMLKDPLSRNAVEAIRNNTSFQNWYGFEEWFAESVAKWAAQEGSSGRTLAEQFFKSLAQQLKELAERIAQAFGRTVDPVNVVMNEYLEYVYAQKDREAPPTVANSFLREEVDEKAPQPMPNMPSFGGMMGRVGVSRQHQQDVDKFAWYVRWGWNLLQLGDQNKHIVGLQDYIQAVRRWHIDKMKWITRAEDRVKEWRGLGKEQAQRLEDFIWELETMPYLKPGEKPRQPTNAELVALARKHQLKAEGLQVWLRIKGDFDAVLGQIEQVWKNDATATITDPNELAAAIRMINIEMQAMRDRPYFPHARFGDWTLSVRDTAGNLLAFRQFENKKARDKAYEQAKRDFPRDDVRVGKMLEQMQVFRGLPPGMIDKVASKLNLNAAQQQQLEELKFDMSPANSWAKHLKKRRGVEGWSTDGLRNYSDYFFYASSHLARIAHQDRLTQAIKDVAESRTTLLNSDKRADIVNYMQRHYDYIMYPPNELAAVRSLGFTWLLGFAPDSALINFTQIPLVAAPYLAARFGDVSAIGALTKSARYWWRNYNAKSSTTMPADELAAHDLGLQHGVLDQSYAAALAAAGHGSAYNRMLGGGQIERLVGGIGQAAAFMFHVSEKINRVIVFHGAYALGKQNAFATDRKTAQYVNELLAANGDLVAELDVKGWRREEIVGYLTARDVVERTMFEYSQWARPEFMRGKKGALFTFFMFLQNMIWFERYSPGNKRHLVLLLATAGLMGLPGAEDILDIVKAFGTKIAGRFFDPETEIRKLAKELGANPTLIARGLGASDVGLQAVGEMIGVPIPGIDLSRRVGMGRVVPGVEALTTQGISFDQRLGMFTEEILGASYGVPLGLVEGLASFNPADAKSFERVLPRAIKNLARSARWAREGEETLGSGATVHEFDVTDPYSVAEMVAGGMGFTPRPIAQKYDQIRAQKEVELYWQTHKALLFDGFWRAVRTRDREALADARAKITKFNSWVPDPGLKISADDLRTSVRNRNRRMREQEAGIPNDKGMVRTAREVQGAFPVEAR